ncbi:unnamed protein product [Paramecium octaurelia]|uniref:Uncharacterized protein n=1 Tax=Paramecium octaurelia TaxID=43137 RepID=A0A8S1TE93_PAROT|nr:unnamed protein product [Paramecium octaurelia]
MGSSCCLAQGDEKVELLLQQKNKQKKKIGILYKNPSLSSNDQNKQDKRKQSYQNQQSYIIDDTGKEYNRMAASTLIIQVLTGDLDRVNSIELSENAIKDIPVKNDSYEIISLESKKTILKKETKYSIFHNKAHLNQNQKKVRFDDV